MATKKDLVEAYSFSRRRLVTAFVSGAPGGREVEPARPGRSIVGGLALSVLLVAGAAIAGVFTSNVDPAWAESAGLVISKEEAEVFVITGAGSQPVLHPILNITSAKLILGSDVEPQVIPEKYIAEEEIGSDLGIFGAPYDVPDVARLIESGWTSCTDGTGLRLSLSERSLVAPAPEDGGMLVTVDDEAWLVATSRPDESGIVGGYRYRVPDADSSSQRLVLAAIGLGPESEPTPVSREWLNLLPQGGDIDPTAFGVDPGPSAGGEPKPGDLLQVNGTPYLTLETGELAPLDPFALAVATGSGERTVGAEYSGDVDSLDFVRGDFVDARWPADLLQPVFGESCVRLLTASGEPPRVQLAQDPEGEAVATGTRGESVSVDAGAGAYVVSGGWGDTSGDSPFVMDSKGVAYPLIGPTAADLLGYAGFEAPLVPDAWIELFDDGVQLSQNAALCEPRVGEKQCA